MTDEGSTDAQGPRKRPGGRSARIAAAVQAATLEILAEDGFAQLSIEEVADRAGTHKTTVYRRWGTRERLVGAALATLSNTTEVPIPDTGTLHEDIVAVAQSVAANLATPLGRAIAQTMVGQGDDPEISRIMEEFWTTRFERTAIVAERAIDRQELPPDTDPRLVIELVVAAIWFRSIVTRAPIDETLIESVVETITT